MRALALLSLGLAACSHPPKPAPSLPSAVPAAAHPAPAPSAPRYVVPQPLAWIERAPGDIDRVVVGGRRLELKGHDVVAMAPADPAVDGGAEQPPWVRGASDPAAYVFWKGADVFVAPSFTGALTKVATLARDVDRASPWSSGLALEGPFGVLAIGPSGSAPARIGVPGAVDAIAASGGLALVLTAFGKIVFSPGGGAATKDITAEFGGGSAIRAVGPALVVRTRGDSERRVDANGGAAPGVSTWPVSAPASDLPPDFDDRWPSSARETALEAAVRAGLPLGDGSAIAASGATYARVDLATGRATSAFAVAEKDAECTPFGARAATLLLCATPDRALVFDVDGGPELERSFDLAGAPDVDRFIGADGEALGFSGPCEGAPPRPEVDAVSGASIANHSPGHSAVFCARADRDHWREHRLDRADAADVLAWIPRAGGDATALVAREGTSIPDADRITERGGLRIVRIARAEPPLSLSAYADRPALLLSRDLRAAPDGTIEAWLPSGSSGTGAALAIDRAGHPRVYPSPANLTSLAAAGPFALANTDDGRLFETVDRGRTWTPAEPPPDDESAAASSCTPVGCRVGSLARIGWTSPAAAPVAAARDPERDALVERARTPRRPPIPPPLARLSCSATSAPEGGRLGALGGFGLSSGPGPKRMQRGRIGSLGMTSAQWTGVSPAARDVDLGWVSPLDLDGVIHRATVPLARGEPAGKTKGLLDLNLGWMLTGDGGVAPVAMRSPGACAASLLDDAGVAVELGDCVPQGAVAVELGDRVFIAAYEEEALVTSVVGTRARAARAKTVRVGAGLRELSRTPVPNLARTRVLGAGSRRGAPVVVAMDASGEAILASLDPASGALGPDEALAPLGALALASETACSRAPPDEARVLLPLDGQIGLTKGPLRGVSDAPGPGFVVLRWSSARVCLDAIQIPVRDERFEADSGGYDQPGTVRELVARFAGATGARLVEIGSGFEMRQPLACRMDER